MIHCLLPLLLVVATFSSNATSVLQGYWEYQDFLRQHPKQHQLVTAFAQQVQKPAIPLTSEQKKPISIAVVYPGEQVSDYWRRNIIAFTKRLEELKIDYSIESVFTPPSHNIRQQSRSLFEALKKAPDYLVFTLDTTKHRKFIQHALGHSKTKLILQNITTPVKAWEGHPPFFYTGFDHSLGSQALASYFKSLYPDGANYAVIYYSRGYISTARGNTFISAMSEQQSYHLQSAYYTQADYDSAYQAAMTLLDENKPLDFIYACATDVAMGTLAALQKRKRSDILLNGWGGGSLELAAIEQGDLDVTVMRMNDDAGVAMAEAIALDIQGKQVPLVFSGTFQIISKNATQETIDDLKQRAFRYSN